MDLLPCPDDKCRCPDLVILELVEGLFRVECTACGQTMEITDAKEWNDLPRPWLQLQDFPALQQPPVPEGLVAYEKALWLRFFIARASFEREDWDVDTIAEEAGDMLAAFRETWK